MVGEDLAAKHGALDEGDEHIVVFGFFGGGSVDEFFLQVVDGRSVSGRNDTCGGREAWRWDNGAALVLPNLVEVSLGGCEGHGWMGDECCWCEAWEVVEETAFEGLVEGGEGRIAKAFIRPLDELRWGGGEAC